jgi:cellobiose transport system permease protein
MFPLWWSVVVASHDSTVLARDRFPLLPSTTAASSP